MKTKKVLIRMKNKIKLYLFVFLLVINILNVSASTTNSSNYKTDIIIASGGDSISSTNYNTNTVIGTITGTTNSTTYKQSLGFFYASGGISAYIEYHPNDPSPLINTTSGTNETYQDLNCFATITDPNSEDKLNVTVKWYKNDSLQLNIDYNNSYTNGFVFNAILGSGNTSLNDVWKCGMRLYDGKNYSNWQNSSNLTIIDPGMQVTQNEFDGSTTDFLAMNDTELQNIVNMTLEVITYGKIIFNEIINLTQDEVNNTIDLDNNINIGNNLIEINITALTSLNKSATLYLYGLGFNNPRILRNGEVCSSSICQIINYSGGILRFNVTMFTTYSAEETPLPDGSPPKSGVPIVVIDTKIIDEVKEIKQMEVIVTIVSKEELKPDDKVRIEEVETELLAPKKPTIINKTYIIIGIIAIILILFIIRMYKRIKSKIIDFKKVGSYFNRHNRQKRKLTKRCNILLKKVNKKLSMRKQVELFIEYSDLYSDLIDSLLKEEEETRLLDKLKEIYKTLKKYGK